VVHWDLFFTVIVAGGISAGLYGFLPISLIMTYRISRTIAFIHGGIAAAAGAAYWILTLHNDLLSAQGDFIIAFNQGSLDPTTFGHRPSWPQAPMMIVIMIFGGLIAGAYGAVVMSTKFASMSALVLTIVSLGAMLGLIGIASILNIEGNLLPDSPFGQGRHQALPLSMTNGLPLNLTNNQIWTFVTVLGLSIVLAIYLTRTHSGLQIRALADDQECGVWCGIKLQLLGTFVYAASGAIAALAGVLVSVTIGVNPGDMLVFVLDGLAIAIVGGLRSLPLSFVGALLYSLTETALKVGFYGDVKLSTQAVILYGLLLSIIVTVATLRREQFFLLERQSL
jgi:branched-subunit amino acid ABC-type transport system permease component